eukprot:2336092-Pyramimonas_sp.AAC.1
MAAPRCGYTTLWLHHAVATAGCGYTALLHYTVATPRCPYITLWQKPRCGHTTHTSGCGCKTLRLFQAVAAPRCGHTILRTASLHHAVATPRSGHSM